MRLTTSRTRSRQCVMLSVLSAATSYFKGSGKMSESDVTRINAANDDQATELAGDIYDIIRTIRDPEKPQSLEELDVVYEDCVSVSHRGNDEYLIRIEFMPTVPHCSLATLIGLCLRVKLERSLPHKFKLDIFIKKGGHSTEDEINKQINDKERIAAAMENPNLRELVERCLIEEE